MTTDFIFIPSGTRFTKIVLSSLIYIRSVNGLCELVTTENKVLTNTKFTKLEKALRSSRFCKVNDDYIVALKQVISFDQKFIQLPGIIIPIQKNYIATLKNNIKILTESGDPPGKRSLYIDAKGCLQRY